jgi:predicted O-methyltransferase YrrM
MKPIEQTDPRDKWFKERTLTGQNLNFCPQATVASTPTRWEPSALLANVSLKWAEVLRESYAHPMAFPGSISPSAGEMLRALIYNIAPNNVVEIGCFMGISTIWMASGLAELGGNRKIYAIDRFEDLPPNAFCPIFLKNPLDYVQTHLEQAELTPLVELHQGDSKVIGPQLAEQLAAPIDFLFIDGDHTIAGCVADFKQMERYVSTGGFILLHDIFPEWCGWEGPAFVVDNYIRHHDRFEVCQIYISPLNFGYALVRKVKSE